LRRIRGQKLLTAKIAKESAEFAEKIVVRVYANSKTSAPPVF